MFLFCKFTVHVIPTCYFHPQECNVSKAIPYMLYVKFYQRPRTSSSRPIYVCSLYRMHITKWKWLVVTKCAAINLCNGKENVGRRCDKGGFHAKKTVRYYIYNHLQRTPDTEHKHSLGYEWRREKIKTL